MPEKLPATTKSRPLGEGGTAKAVTEGVISREKVVPKRPQAFRNYQ